MKHVLQRSSIECICCPPLSTSVHVFNDLCNLLSSVSQLFHACHAFPNLHSNQGLLVQTGITGSTFENEVPMRSVTPYSQRLWSGDGAKDQAFGLNLPTSKSEMFDMVRHMCWVPYDFTTSKFHGTFWTPYASLGSLLSICSNCLSANFGSEEGKAA